MIQLKNPGIGMTHHRNKSNYSRTGRFRKLFPLLMLLVLFSAGCDHGKRQQELKEREAQVAIKEQELAAREQQLQVLEQELKSRQNGMDSMATDTSFEYQPWLVGRWDVKMDCVETGCPGSAIGDTKTEQWEIAYQGRSIIARVLVNNTVTRVYTGSYDSQMLKLMSQSYEEDPAKTTVMHIRLQQVAEGRLEGVREIDRPENCRIVYNLQLTRP
ncbi:MAG: hypothetical protein EOP49_39615 [Sphingobacteriales bacterium]|nr:MAG: hypothetical protein EOP49_39615 [Sphingobacteriales bacterium]